MKKKLIIIISIVLVLVIGFVVWWNVPTQMINVDYTNVEEIIVFNGNTGKEVTLVSGDEETKRIIQHMGCCTVKKDEFFGLSMGYHFRVSIKLKNDLIGGLNGWNEFYMNSEEGFSKNGIFYKITQGDGKFLYLELCDLFLEEDEKIIGHH